MVQDRKIAELENHGRTVAITLTDTAEASTLLGSSSRSSGITVDIHIVEIKSAMQKMTEMVSSQAILVAALTRHIANNGSGSGRGGINGGVGGIGGHTTIKKDKHEC